MPNTVVDHSHFFVRSFCARLFAAAAVPTPAGMIVTHEEDEDEEDEDLTDVECQGSGEFPTGDCMH